MKELAVLLILVGSGLTAYGLAGFSGEFSPNSRSIDETSHLEGSFGWSSADREQIVLGVVVLVGGLLLRNSKTRVG
jgi:hypothetical protein